MFLKMEKKRSLLFASLFVVSYLCGSVFMYYYGNKNTADAGIFGSYHLKNYPYLNIDYKNLFLMLVKERGKWLVFMWSFGYTGLGIIFAWCFPAIWGFLLAVVTSSFLNRLGTQGMLVTICTMLPQALIYGPLWLWLLNMIADQSLKRSRSGRIRFFQEQSVGYLVVLLIGLLFLFLGILTETYLNSALMQWVLKQT